MKRFRAVLLALFWLGLGTLLGFGIQFLPGPIKLGEDSALLISSSAAQTVQVTLEPGNIILAQPAQPSGTVFVFYPGGLVAPQAYEFMARALASQGITVAIPAVPLELAVLSPNRANDVKRLLESKKLTVSKFVVGGHSLGGAMAAQYAAGNAVDGLVLMGAYPAGNSNLSSKRFPVLNLAAQFDGVAEGAKVRDGLNRLPSGTQVTLLEGGVHSFFGRYGPQRGDGIPTVTRAEFEDRLLERLTAFLEGI